jgi:hypothetical protein
MIDVPQRINRVPNRVCIVMLHRLSKMLMLDRMVATNKPNRFTSRICALRVEFGHSLSAILMPITCGSSRRSRACGAVTTHVIDAARAAPRAH